MRKSAALHRACVVSLYRGDTAVKGRLINFLEQDGNARVGEDHGDAAAHGAGANNRRGTYGQERSFFWDVGDFSDFPLTKEDMNQSLRLIGKEAFGEQLLFRLAAFVERQFHRCFDGLNGREWCRQATLLLSCRVARGNENRCILFSSAKLFMAFARLERRFAGDFARKG